MRKQAAELQSQAETTRQEVLHRQQEETAKESIGKENALAEAYRLRVASDEVKEKVNIEL